MEPLAGLAVPDHESRLIVGEEDRGGDERAIGQHA